MGRKNPDEAFTWDDETARYGLDVWLAYFLLKEKWLFKSLILGDYKIDYGQGLVANTGFGISKGSDALPSIRTSKGIKPHTSLATYGLRGVAATAQWGAAEMTAYYACTYLDGNVQDDSSGEKYVERVYRNRKHTTEGEVASKAKVKEQVIGIALLKRNHSAKAELGLNMLHNHYAIPIRPDPTPEGNHSFSGQDNTNISLFYRYLWQNLDFFGEGAISFGEDAISLNGAKAALFGVRTGRSPQIGAMLLFRHYDPNFYSPYGEAFRENSSANKNEQGLYLALRLRPLKKLTLNAYYDYFRFPAPTTTIPQRSAGYEWLIKATYQLGTPMLLLLQCKETSKAKKRAKNKSKKDTPSMADPKKDAPLEDTPSVADPKKDAPSESIDNFHHYKCKVQLRYAVGRNIYLSSEAQGSIYNWLRITWGYAVCQSITYKKKELSITGQIAWFDTDFDNKLAFYEKVVLYSKPFPDSYGNKGIKCSLYVCYKPMPSWQIELNYVLSWPLGERRNNQYNEAQNDKKNVIQNKIKLQLVSNF